jgi:hypothetical protein
MLHSPFNHRMTAPSSTATAPGSPAPTPVPKAGSQGPPGPTGSRLAPYRRRIPAPAAIAIAAVVSGLFFFFVVQPVLDANLLDCGDGLDSLGCALMSRLVIVVVTYTLAGLAGVGVLWLFGLRRALPVGLFGGLTMGAGWTFLRAVADSKASVAVIGIVSFGVCFALYHLLFNRVPLPVPALWAAAAGIVVGAFFGLTLVGGRIDMARYIDEQERLVDDATFDVYVPGFAPGGFRFAGGTLSGAYAGEEKDDEYYELDLRNAEDRYLVMTSFQDTPAFDPPRNCGWDHPYDQAPVEPCHLVGTTRSGVDVFQSTSSGNPDGVWFARVGRSVVSLKDANTLTPIPDEVALALYGSLEKKTGAELRAFEHGLDRE